jgi:subtilase family serine protease
MFRRSILASTVALALVLPACGGGGGHSAAIPTTSGPTQTGLQGGSVGTLAYGASMLAGATQRGAASLGTVHFQAMVRLSNGPGLEAYANMASDPTSGVYRQFLSSSLIGARYGATDADYAAAATYFQSFGLKVGGWPQKLSLSITGKQADVERAFGTTLVTYQGANGLLIGPKSAPQLPASVPVVAIGNLVKDLSKAAQYRAMVPAPRGQGNNFAGGYTPEQVATAFDYTSAYAAGFTGAGVKLGIIGTGPVDPADLASYKATFNWPNALLGRNGAGVYKLVPASSAAAAKTTPVGTGSPTATPPPVTAPCSGTLPACNPEDGEAQIDTEQALLAPDAETDLYLAYVPTECGSPTVTTCAPDPNTGYGYAYIGLAEADDAIQQAIADNTGGGAGPDILSLSYGGSEVGNAYYFTDNKGAYSASSFGVVEFAALAAEGVATFVSSGDAGAQGCARPAVAGSIHNQCVSWPSSSADVMSVGGVTTPVDNSGRYIGPITGWGFQTNAGSSGTGGGLSAYIPLPTWQTGPGITGSFRNQPDVSLNGDPITAVSTIVNSNYGFAGTGGYGGTSVAAPEMAAMWALVLSACRVTTNCKGPGGTYRFGNPGPVLYKIYNTPAQYANTFYDVTFGNNGVIPCRVNPGQVGPCPAPVPTPDPGFNAGVGYDQMTGIGVPFARHLINTLVGV